MTHQIAETFITWRKPGSMFVTPAQAGVQAFDNVSSAAKRIPRVHSAPGESIRVCAQ